MDKQSEEGLHRIFPLAFYKSKIGLADQEREILIEEIYIQEQKSNNLESKFLGNAWTGDVQGHEFLHLNKKFEKLYKLISINVKKYTELLGINNNEIDFYFQRSWATISKGKENIKPHSHKQSHLSFAYYLKKNKNDGNIIFHNQAAQNEIAPELFNRVNEKSKRFYTTTYDNANNIVFKPEVDEIYIFPSKVLHSTTPNETDDLRISISADISLIAKDSSGNEHLMTPIAKWLKF